MPKTVARLGADAWEQAALGAIAGEGLAGVAVEPLARALRVTKGSFYWHFRDRDALVAAAVRRWKRESIDDVLAELVAIADPLARLRRLVTRALSEPLHGRLEVSFAAAVGDPLIARTFKKSIDERMAFLTTMFVELGMSRRAAQRRSMLAYAMFAGLYQLLAASPSMAIGSVEPFVDDIVATLTAKA